MKDALSLLFALDTWGYLQLFWFHFVFEVPRYTLSTFAVGWRATVSTRTPLPPADLPVSVLLVGHNEADSLAQTVASLHEQSHKALQIVVIDDGSTDSMGDLGQSFLERGMIDQFRSTGIRGGKASALNLGFSLCEHEHLVAMDIDTSLDRDAIAQIVAPLLDHPDIGAVSGNLTVRNVDASLLTNFQFLEYATNISVGRQFTSMFGILTIVSGAFGAFRKSAISSVGLWDVGPGDDSNLTMKLRRAGWFIRFAPDAWAFTDVPTDVSSLVKQRMRWSRSLIRNQLRKFKSVFNTNYANFRLRDVMAAINILWFQLVLGIAFAFYMALLLIEYNDIALTLIIAVHILIFIGNLFEFCVAATFLPRLNILRKWPYLIGYSFYITYFQRAIRLIAYFRELTFRDSYRDTFYPVKVQLMQDQF